MREELQGVASSRNVDLGFTVGSPDFICPTNRQPEEETNDAGQKAEERAQVEGGMYDLLKGLISIAVIGALQVKSKEKSYSIVTSDSDRNDNLAANGASFLQRRGCRKRGTAENGEGRSLQDIDRVELHVEYEENLLCVIAIAVVMKGVCGSKSLQ